ncbi:NADH-quinone oxidoreductase subunit D [Branchiibius sp. NY16-3462-2]|uniref:NADH-quinone oxidoreductase subunit D n=1 Tax=Branchiibius sp. NY16-3462-2 TaxID=1807500 RepID=UPI0007966F9F|nr:NADH-quinone oxidoreductase subunit D [Branchiibius sp. NY16-3462-2]KYH46268.1 NADH-quinone oxidoreductase subunit D [Branchiibius sp. NY16-3462-2]
MATREVTVGVGAAGLATADMVLNIGPQHPATHGVLRLRVTLDGERIVTAEPIVGYMHRGAEKLFEVRDYRQIMVLANRHDWLSAFSSEIGLALLVERMLGMEVPERATWTRTLLAELNRVLNHLMFAGSYPLELGAMTPIFYSFREREELQAVMEQISGGRMHYMFNRVGGLRDELPAGWLDNVSSAVAAVRRRLPDLEGMLLGNEILTARTRGVGVLDQGTISAYGVSGPIARASGLDVDLRRDQPYLAYAELFGPSGPGRVVTRTEGDCLARFEVLLEQIHVSLDLADACVERLRSLPAGPVNLKLPKVLKVPEGTDYLATENPLGFNGYYLVSRGEKTPWRLKLRSASFNNVSALAQMLPGQLLADMVAILGSMFFVVGDIDK